METAAVQQVQGSSSRVIAYSVGVLRTLEEICVRAREGVREIAVPGAHIVAAIERSLQRAKIRSQIRRDSTCERGNRRRVDRDHSIGHAAVTLDSDYYTR